MNYECRSFHLSRHSPVMTEPAQLFFSFPPPPKKKEEERQDGFFRSRTRVLNFFFPPSLHFHFLPFFSTNQLYENERVLAPHSDDRLFAFN